MKNKYKTNKTKPIRYWSFLIALSMALIVPISEVKAAYCAAAATNVAITPTIAPQVTASYNNMRRAFNFAATSGVTYTFETCGLSPGDMDTYLRLYSTGTGGTELTANDDVCGLQSRITWTCPANGTYSILLTRYNAGNDCANLNSAVQVRYFIYTPHNPCAGIGTFTCGAATNTSVTTSGDGAWDNYGGLYATPGKERLFTFTPTVTGLHTFNTVNNDYYQDLFYKPVSAGCNSTGWTYVDDVYGTESNSINLTAGIAYYIMFDNEESEPVISTTTIICPTLCSPPSALNAVVTGAGTGANISWTAGSPAPASGYQYAVTTSATPPGSGTVFAGTSTSVGSLTPSTTYYLHVRANCAGLGFSNWQTFSFYTGYCQITGNQNLNTRLNRFAITGAITNFNNAGSGFSPNGYGNFTALSCSQIAGASVNFIMNFPSNPGAAIYVDWNNNLVFDLSERMYNSAGYVFGPVNGSFAVPGGQAPGNYRMRAVVDWLDTDPSACASGIDGEVEDYTFIVATPPPCGLPTGLAAVMATATTVNLSWTAPGAGTVIDYQYAFTTSATPPGSGTNNATTSVSGVSVTANTNYYLHVRTNCTGPTTGPWATYGPFYTGYCLPTITNVGDYISTFNTTLGITNITNSGTGTAAFQDFTAQSVSQLANQSINFSSAYVGGDAGFNIWVDWNSNFVFEAGEKVYSAAVLASTWNASFSVPALQAAGNYRMRVRAQWNVLDPPACGNTAWGQTEDYTFTVAAAPSCAAVSGLNATPVTLSTADLSWNAAVGGISAPVQYYYAVTTSATPPAFGSWISNGLSNTVTGAATVPNVQNYLHVRTDCDPLMSGSNYSAWSVLSFYSGYCISTATVSNVNYITNVTTTGAANNINSTSSFTSGGYEDHTSLVPNVTEYSGGTFAFVAALQAPVAVGFNVWVDWNNDLDFNDFGELVATSNGYQYTGTPFNYGNSITIPPAATPGNYRMRMRVTNNPVTMPACGNIPQGETEDYTLTVIPVPNCSGATYAGTYTTTTDLPLVCTGQTVNFSVTPEPPVAVGVTYQLQYSATQFGTYNTIATQSNIDFPIAAASSGWYKIRIVCNGTPLALTYTSVSVSINNPAITTTTPASRCGNGSVTLAATATPAASTITWYQTALGGIPVGTGPSYTTASLSNTTSYYVQAENQIPVSTIGNNNISQDLMNNTPFSSFYQSARTFYMITKSELNAAGFLGGDLSSLAFDVSVTGAVGQNNFRISIAHTVETSVNAGLLTANGGFTQVLNPVTVPPPAIGWKVFNFDNVFPWNGIDNIIIEICHNSPAWGANSAVLSSITSYNSVCGIYEDPTNLCGATTGDFITPPNNLRPNMRIGGIISLCNSPRIEVVATINSNPQLTSPGNSTFAPTVGNFIPIPITASSSTLLTPVTFSPSSGIYINALTSGLYNLGDDINGVTQYSAPLSTTTYTATATSPNGCTTSSNFTITVDPSGIPNSACGAVPITVTNTMYYNVVNTLGAVTGLGAPCGGIAKEAWFVATVPASGEVHVTTRRNGSSLTDVTETNVALFTGAVCTALSNVACNSNGGYGDFSYAHWYGMTPGTQLYIRVAGLSAASVANGRIRLAVTSHLIWTPTNGTNFSLAENWQDGDAAAITVPNATRSVLIPANTISPKLNANSTVRSVNIQAPAPYFVTTGIVLQGFNLNVKGNWNVGPSINASTTLYCSGTVEFNGSDPGAQLITGRTTFGNLSINNTGGGVQANGLTNVTCVLTSVAGNLNANGNIVLKSTDENSAALVAPSGSGTITGNVIVERKIGATSGYHYLSSAVAGAITNNTTTGWRDDFTILSSLDGQTFIPGNTYSQLATVWEYDETNANPNPNYGWNAATGITDNITPLKGFACVVPGNVTVDVMGPLNNNIIPGGYTITRATDGLNVVGNPYASPISWNAFRALPANTSALSTSGYQAFITSGGYAGSYGTWNGSVGSPVSVTDRIASSQSFLVECLQPTATINALNSIRLTTAADVTATFFNGYNAVPDMIRMEVQGNGNASEMVVYFDASSVDSYNNSFDSRVMFSPVAGVPTIYSIVENNSVAINVMGKLDMDKIVPLGVKIQAAGAYNLVATDMTSFAPSVIAYLEDTQTGTITNLRINPSYSVTLPAGIINNRFFIHFHPAVELNAVNETCAGNDGKLVINYPTTNTVNIVIKDANGNVVNTQNNLTGVVTVNNLVAGNYVAEMTFGIAPNTYTTSDYFTVSGGNAVYANLSASVNTVDLAANTTVNFTATAQGATSFNWNFGDGTVITNGPANVAHTFAHVGTYNVTFEASNGICTTVATTTVEATNTTGLTAISNSNLQVVGAVSKVTIRFGSKMEGTGTIEVINMLGEVVAHLDNVSMKGTREIDMSTVAAGQYMVKITNNNNLYTAKVYLSRQW